jgi:hypothetical protein
MGLVNRKNNAHFVYEAIQWLMERCECFKIERLPAEDGEPDDDRLWCVSLEKVDGKNWSVSSPDETIIAALAGAVKSLDK